jgi:predicted ATPase
MVTVVMEQTSKIEEIKIAGFRSLKNLTWQPAKLNLVIGRNGSGKSNLLKFFELISASAEGNLSEYIRISGGIKELLWDGDADNIKFNFDATMPNLQSNSLTYELTLTQVGNTSLYRVEHELLANYEQVQKGLKTEPFKLIERQGTRNRLFDENQRSLSAKIEETGEEETLLSLTDSPFIEKKYRQAAYFKDYLKNWRVYQDIRTDRKSFMRSEPVLRHEKQVSTDGQNLINVMYTLYESRDNTTFREIVDEALQAVFGKEYRQLSFPVNESGKIEMAIRWNSLRRATTAANLSDGTLRFLFLLAIFANPSPASLIALDEPELGLHPSMLPIVAEFATNAAKKSQVIITTHSPQFLSAFDKDAEPVITVAEWLDGETHLLNLANDRLAYWLERYTLGELFDSGEFENLAKEALGVA